MKNDKFFVACNDLQAYVLQEQGKLLELVDPSLGTNYSEQEVLNMLNLSLACTNISPSLRPSMSAVVSMLESQIPVQAPVFRNDHGIITDHMRLKAIGKLSDGHTQSSIYSQDSKKLWPPSIPGKGEADLYDVYSINSSSSLPGTGEIKSHSSTSQAWSDLYGANPIDSSISLPSKNGGAHHSSTSKLLSDVSLTDSS